MAKAILSRILEGTSNYKIGGHVSVKETIAYGDKTFKTRSLGDYSITGCSPDRKRASFTMNEELYLINEGKIIETGLS
jgi:hypothetical protein